MTALSTLLFFQTAKAEGMSWLSGEPTGRVRTDITSLPGNCVTKQVRVGNSQAPETPICIYQAKGFSYGIYQRFIPTSPWDGYTDRSFVIGFAGDKLMYRVKGLPDNDPPIYMANSGSLLYRWLLGWSSWGYTMQMIKHLPSKLTKVHAGDVLGSTEYELKPDAYQVMVPNEDGEYTMTRSVGISKNGKWAAVELRPGGLLRINLATGEKKWFSRYEAVYGQGSDGLMEFALSDDGSRIAVVGINIEPQLFEINNQCGKDTTAAFLKEWRSDSSALTHPCPGKELSTAIDNVRGGDLRFARQPLFNADATELTMHTTPYWRPGSNSEEKWITLTVAGYQAPQLDYLALGDSYSSGEGDIRANPQTNGKYYREWTDNERDDSKGILREKCHLSTRSYPYVVANLLDLSIGKQWNSVACSGAVKADIGPIDGSYKGQEERLSSLSSDKQEVYQARALNEFIPGREQQIAFVKKYKPKVITLTMAGNDVGFGKVLRRCVNPFQEWTSICSYVLDVKRKSELANDIKKQFAPLHDLYSQLFEASDHRAKIYVLGYPQFVNEGAHNALCGLNVRLNTDERHMISEGVRYMNSVIKAATQSAGVKYIDITQSLEGHRLCDQGDKAMTGIVMGVRNEVQESFHPNAFGHSLITGAFLKQLNWQSPLDYSNCPLSGAIICPDSDITEPPVPDYFQQALDADNRNTSHQSFVDENEPVTKTTPFTIISGPSALESNSPISVMLYSEPKSLGSYTTDSDGGLNANITIPSDIPVGYHTLVISGKTYSGEPIDLWQIIQVQGADPRDRDEDGTPDNQDACLFIQPAGVDEDHDGTDDACDPYIGDPEKLEAITRATISDLKQKYASAHGVKAENIQQLAPIGTLGKAAHSGDTITRSNSPTVWPFYILAGSLVVLSGGVWIRRRLERKKSSSHTENNLK